MIPGNLAIAVMGPERLPQPGRDPPVRSAVRVQPARGTSQYWLWLGHLLRRATSASPGSSTRAWPRCWAPACPRPSSWSGSPPSWRWSWRSRSGVHPGGAPEQVHRPLLQRVLHRLLRDARLPARHPADPVLRDQDPDLPARGPAGRGPGRAVHELQRADPADHLAGADHASRCSAGTCAPRCWTTSPRTTSAPPGPRGPASGGC